MSISAPEPLTGIQADVTDDERRRVFDGDVLGVVRVTRAALLHPRRSPSAAIAGTCSSAATAGLPERAPYSAAKGAVLSLTRATAVGLLRSGNRVDCVTRRHR